MRAVARFLLPIVWIAFPTRFGNLFFPTSTLGKAPPEQIVHQAQYHMLPRTAPTVNADRLNDLSR